MATPKPSSSCMKQPTWHPHYDDETADIIFVSNDGIMFGMGIKVLAKSSTVFADMRNLPTSPASQQKSGQSIHLDYDAKILLQFIELVSIHNFESIVINLGFRACRALLPLLIQLDCARLRHAVRQQLYKSASGKGEAWELFKFGAVRDDWEMGRQGLKRMSQDQVIHLLASCPTFIGILTTLPAEWQFALSSTIMASSFDSRQLAMDWSQQASKFHRPGSLADQAMALSEHKIPVPTLVTVGRGKFANH